MIPPAKKLTILQPHVQLADPHIASDNKNRLSILAAMFEALVQRDHQGHYQPLLAEQWSVTEDARSWTFYLRQGIVCHNGDELEAEDVVASLQRARSPNLGGDLGTEGLYQSYLKEATFQAVDRYTARVVLAEPMADLPDLLVDIPVMPRQALNNLPEKPSGSGPYRLVEATPELVVMETFDSYWAGEPPLRQLTWQAKPDSERRVEALLTNEADLISDVSLSGRRIIEAAEQVELVAAPSSVCATFMCNLMTGVCQDKRVRQALNYALNVPEIIERIMAGTARPINGPLTDLHFGYEPTLPPYPYDPAQARALLHQAGYKDGLQLTLNVPTILPNEAQDVADLMAGYYAEVGITTEIKVFTDRPGYANMVKAKQIDDACCFDSSPLSTLRPLREKFHSGVSGPWWLGYSNAEVNALIDRACVTIDTSQRQQIYRRAYGIIRDDAPWIFLYSPTLAWGIGSRTRGWKPDIDGVIRLKV